VSRNVEDGMKHYFALANHILRFVSGYMTLPSYSNLSSRAETRIIIVGN